MALVVITGGARSGKSSAAQRLAETRLQMGVPVTVAVFGRGDDEEMRDRISRHRADRPTSFRTLEVTVSDISADPAAWLLAVSDDGLLVVDCLGTLLGLVMEVAWTCVAEGGLEEAAAHALPAGFAARVEADFGRLVETIAGRRGDTLVVTNEVGSGIVPEWASGRLFRDLLGSANRALVGAADAAHLAVAGRLLPLADLPTQCTWPAD